jgi:hypothetical protein
MFSGRSISWEAAAVSEMIPGCSTKQMQQNNYTYSDTSGRETKEKHGAQEHNPEQAVNDSDQRILLILAVRL